MKTKMFAIITKHNVLKVWIYCHLGIIIKLDYVFHVISSKTITLQMLNMVTQKTALMQLCKLVHLSYLTDTRKYGRGMFLLRSIKYRAV